MDDKPIGQPLRILVVDDHPDTTKVFKRLLSLEGYTVTTAGDFEEALASAQAEQFDVLLCDICLPDRDGCDVLAEVRSLYPIRSIAITGHTTPEDIQGVTDAGFDECLVKPVDLERLRVRLANLASEIEFDSNRDRQLCPSPKLRTSERLSVPL
jgi:two-component system CheB/CheR fusion protein